MKFSIRDLLLVMVIVAMALGWGIDRWRLSREIWRLSNYDLPFRDATLEQILYEHGIKVEFTEPGKCIVTENGKTTEREFPTGQKRAGGTGTAYASSYAVLFAVTAPNTDNSNHQAWFKQQNTHVSYPPNPPSAP